MDNYLEVLSPNHNSYPADVRQEAREYLQTIHGYYLDEDKLNSTVKDQPVLEDQSRVESSYERILPLYV
jgi:hypothetical protein